MVECMRSLSLIVHRVPSFSTQKSKNLTKEADWIFQYIYSSTDEIPGLAPVTQVFYHWTTHQPLIFAFSKHCFLGGCIPQHIMSPSTIWVQELWQVMRLGGWQSAFSPSQSSHFKGQMNFQDNDIKSTSKVTSVIYLYTWLYDRTYINRS